MQEADDKRSIFNAMKRGFLGKCPKCGEGRIFDGPLSVAPRCDHCAEDLSHQRADDLPAYLNIFIVGHVVVGAAMIMMHYELMGLWAMTFTTAAICILVGVTLMRPLKGMVVGNQWALKMHGFGDEDSPLS